MLNDDGTEDGEDGNHNFQYRDLGLNSPLPAHGVGNDPPSWRYGGG